MFCVGLNDLAAVRIRDAGVFPVKMEASREIDSTFIITGEHFMNHNRHCGIGHFFGLWQSKL